MTFKDNNSAKWMINLIVPHLVHLCDHSVHHFSFEWPKHNGLVLDGVQDKPSAWLDYTCPNVVNGGDCNDKAIPERELLSEIINIYMSNI